MARGPLAVRYGDWTLDPPQAGALGHARATVENIGTVRWSQSIQASYHWLDDRDNPIVWDGERTPLPALAPGEQASVEVEVRAPIPPGRYRFALDLVAENRAWFSELGSPFVSMDAEVAPRAGVGHTELPDWVERTPEWDERVASAHAEGFAVVAGAIHWQTGPFKRAPHVLAPYAPGPGRVPAFPHALLCPSVLPGTDIERLPDIEGLPAYAAPAPYTEPWIYDGRIVLNVDARRRA